MPTLDEVLETLLSCFVFLDFFSPQHFFLTKAAESQQKYLHEPVAVTTPTVHLVFLVVWGFKTVFLLGVQHLHVRGVSMLLAPSASGPFCSSDASLGPAGPLTEWLRLEGTSGSIWSYHPTQAGPPRASFPGHFPAIF